MAVPTGRVLSLVETANRENFPDGIFRTEPMTPALAVQLIRRIPGRDGFDPERVAEHLRMLPSGTEEEIRVGKTAGAIYLSISIPGDRRAALEWANDGIDRMSATGLKMNLGPGKPTDLKIFWGKPDINTLIDIGGPE